MKKHMLMLAMAMLSFLKFTYSQTDSSGYYDSIPKTDPAVVMDSIYSAINPAEIVSGILMDKGITDLTPRFLAEPILKRIYLVHTTAGLGFTQR